jgi:MFS superfamily sulfate permease-like transporter
MALVPSGVFFVLSVMLYSFSVEFIEENKISGYWELFIVMSAVLLMTVTGILFFGLVFAIIAGSFKKLFSWLRNTFRRKGGQNDIYRIPEINVSLIKEKDER